MDYLYIVIVSILIVSALMIVLLTNTKNSNNIILQGNKLTIFHPLKREDINLDADLQKWNVQKIQTLWRGKFYSLNLQLKSGKWNRLYSRNFTGKIAPVIEYLENTSPEKKAE
ncbi:hypothetical protein [Cyclobacterium marinum]|uniref:Uncharacterized protein n=1 Tax=Cyclobacterium marinum (strain ATCC 25205 / DSM 745 / LMG 13164 / NCIMB 1802) TaxID=880070 RepID=G0IXP5_CYCMS|nr:hypothetical protein [Cyclobacterium marinum]AEL28042.1 hypothetical protein Cycma_4340 [Cyclobacterium marinum DSM 745]MBI0397813.1 hypothetical protein [Cyclobacterium marinum]MBR9777708.1 hypothetical protein [Cytophagales bacterium]|tara:strand:+ start:10379 stop:10717 length:339 start_codon:yes stop_codon:yes gene_type:complete